MGIHFRQNIRPQEDVTYTPNLEKSRLDRLQRLLTLHSSGIKRVDYYVHHKPDYMTSSLSRLRSRRVIYTLTNFTLHPKEVPYKIVIYGSLAITESSNSIFYISKLSSVMTNVITADMVERIPSSIPLDLTEIRTPYESRRRRNAPRTSSFNEVLRERARRSTLPF